MSGARMAAISVSVKLFGDLRRYAGRDPDEARMVLLPTGSTVADLLAAVGVPAENEVTPGLNGDLAGRDSVLKDGDSVLLFGPMEGG